MSADINFASGTLLVEYEPGADVAGAVVATVRASGHGAESLDAPAGAGPEVARPWLDRYRAEVATAGSGLFSAIGAASGWLGAPRGVVVGAFAVAIAFGGLLVWRRALVSLKARILDMNVLMSTAVFGAAALGDWGESATVFFLFALGGLLESRSLEKTRRSIRGLMELAPPVARVRRQGEVVEVAVAEVAAGDTVIARPGERLPVDGVVSSGATAIDEAAITGESMPAEKSAGDKVFAGTLNTTGLIEFVAASPAVDSTIARLVHMVEEAQASKAPSQTLVERFTRYYTPTVLAIAAAVALLPPLAGAVFGIAVGPWQEWFGRSLVMLVVSCPCALVISTPVSIVSAITRASRDGVLVKGGIFLETAAKVRAIAFDKTGTLTRGVPEVVDVLPFGDHDEAGLLGIAATLEGHSNHPLAQAVFRAAGVGMPGAVADFSERPGEGVSGTIEGARWEVCSPARAESRGMLSARSALAVADAEDMGRTVLVVLSEEGAAGIISVADTVRDEAAKAAGGLRRLGIEHLVMLTGDNERIGDAVTTEVGLTGFLARLLPEAKTEAVGVLRERYGTVAMVGDGVNDAPALAASDLGIAMGAAGTDTALETADVALMRDDLSALPGFFALGRRTVRTIAANVVFSVVIKMVVLVLAVLGYANLWMAVFADTGVSLLVILNGMRLLRSRDA